jgi:cell wall-associated NlpC family hydrolase
MVGLKIMKKGILILMFILVAKVSLGQTKQDSVISFSQDSVLNEFIVKWIGKPYKLGGRTENGIDCSQFNKRLYKDVYGLNLENVCYKQWNQTQRIKIVDLKIGDLIFFRSKSSPSGWHCAVYIGETLFVHAANRYEGVKVSSLEDPRYKKTYRGAGRVLTNLNKK